MGMVEEEDVNVEDFRQTFLLAVIFTVIDISQLQIEDLGSLQVNNWVDVHLHSTMRMLWTLEEQQDRVIRVRTRQRGHRQYPTNDLLDQHHKDQQKMSGQMGHC
jgi:hypothetical protein